MRAEEIMHKDPRCCGPDTTLHDVARMMVECDCGAVPVLDTSSRKPLGIVTDRDIVCRAVAEDKDPRQIQASAVMSKPVVPVKPEDSIEECRDAMERFQVRRLLVVNDAGEVAGIVTQAQLARALSEKEAGQILKGVSRKSDKPSRVTAAP